MHRRLMVLLTVVVMTVLLAAAPALADQGGSQHEGSCGVGKDAAHESISEDTRPGASECALFPPKEFGCTG